MEVGDKDPIEDRLFGRCLRPLALESELVPTVIGEADRQACAAGDRRIRPRHSKAVVVDVDDVDLIVTDEVPIQAGDGRGVEAIGLVPDGDRQAVARRIRETKVEDPIGGVGRVRCRSSPGDGGWILWPTGRPVAGRRGCTPAALRSAALPEPAGLEQARRASSAGVSGEVWPRIPRSQSGSRR